MPSLYVPVVHTPIYCYICGAKFRPKDKRRTRCYDTECHREYKRRGMQDYLRRYKEEHGRGYYAGRRTSEERRVYTITCAYCGNAHQAQQRDTKYCSLECGQRGRYKKTTDLVKYKRPRVHVPTETRGEGFTAGRCPQCGEYFVEQWMRRYCSTACSRRAEWHRRYKRRGKFSVTSKERIALYERDQWACQLCSLPVNKDAHYLDADAPTLDHIVPQSAQLIPDHSASNLQLAHRGCNSARGVTPIDEWVPVRAQDMYEVGGQPRPHAPAALTRHRAGCVCT